MDGSYLPPTGNPMGTMLGAQGLLSPVKAKPFPQQQQTTQPQQPTQPPPVQMPAPSMGMPAPQTPVQTPQASPFPNTQELHPSFAHPLNLLFGSFPEAPTIHKALQDSIVIHG